MLCSITPYNTSILFIKWFTYAYRVLFFYFQVQQTAQSIKSSIEAEDTISVTSPMTSSSTGRANQDKAAMMWSRAECELYRRDWDIATHIDCYDCYDILHNIMLSVINVLLCETNVVPRCISVCTSTFSLQCSCQYELNVAIQCIYRRVVLTLLRYFIIYYYNLYHYVINMC